MNFPALSNLAFLIPLSLTIIFGMTTHSFLLLAVIFFSILYHKSKEVYWSNTDLFLAIALIAYNLYLCYLFKFHQPYFGFALLFVFIAFCFYLLQKRNYSLYHSFWHIASAVITSLCVIGYINGTILN